MTSWSWTDYEPSERDKLITGVNRGELTPEQAESEAARLGLESFEVRPDPAAYNPMNEAWWTLVMALAWVMFRSPEAVRAVWDDYRSEFRFWVGKAWQVPGGPLHEGYFLESKTPAELADLLLENRTRPQVLGVRDDEDAVRVLCNIAARAHWKANGVPKDGGTRREIEPFEWLDARCTKGDLQIGYTDIRLPTAGLLDSVPEQTHATRQIASKINAERECEQWLQALMRKSPDQRRTNASLWAEARQIWPHLSREAFDRAKAAAIKSTGAVAWSKAGASKKSPGRKSRG